MLKIIFFINLIACFSISCQHYAISVEQNIKKNRIVKLENRQDFESVIYGKVLDEYKEKYGSEKLLIINESTFGSVSPDNSSERVIKFLEKRVANKNFPDLIQNFKEVNKIPQAIPSEIYSPLKYSIFEKEKLPQIDENYFINGQPLEGGLVQFSKIGFTSDWKTALVYISFQNGNRSGWAYLYYSQLKRN